MEVSWKAVKLLENWGDVLGGGCWEFPRLWNPQPLLHFIYYWTFCKVSRDVRYSKKLIVRGGVNDCPLLSIYLFINYCSHTLCESFLRDNLYYIKGDWWTKAAIRWARSWFHNKGPDNLTESLQNDLLGMIFRSSAFSIILTLIWSLECWKKLLLETFIWDFSQPTKNLERILQSRNVIG